MFNDPKSMNRLKRVARRVSKFRGHQLGRFMPLHSYAAVADCKHDNCHASVYVCTKPQPNEVDISGSAIAVNCGSVACTYPMKHLAPPYRDDK